MGRAEKRAKEKQKKKQQNQNRINQTYKVMREYVAHKDDLLSDNASCLSTAFALVLSEDYNMTQDNICDILEKVQDLISQIGSEKYPDTSVFKISCALAHGLDIGLNEKEQERVNELYNAAWNNIPSDNYDIEIIEEE